MVDVLVDINLTEASLKIGSDTTGIRITDTTNMRIRFAEVFRKHDVDPDDFNSSLSYYLEHIDDLDKIYAEVITRLTTLEATLREEPGHLYRPRGPQAPRASLGEDSLRGSCLHEGSSRGL